MIMLAEGNGIDTHTAFQATKSDVRSGLYEKLMTHLLDGTETKDTVRHRVRLGATSDDGRKSFGVAVYPGGYGVEPKGRLQALISQNRQRVIEWNKNHRQSFEEYAGVWSVQAFSQTPYGPPREAMTEAELSEHQENYKEGQGLNRFGDSLKVWSRDFRKTRTPIPEKK